AGFVDRAALLLSSGVGSRRTLSGLLAQLGTGQGTDHSGHFLAAATTYLIAKQTAGSGAQQGAGDAAFIAHRRLLLHGNQLANLPRLLPGSGQWLDMQHSGVLYRVLYWLRRLYWLERLYWLRGFDRALGDRLDRHSGD